MRNRSASSRRSRRIPLWLAARLASPAHSRRLHKTHGAGICSLSRPARLRCCSRRRRRRYSCRPLAAAGRRRVTTRARQLSMSVCPSARLSARLSVALLASARRRRRPLGCASKVRRRARPREPRRVTSAAIERQLISWPRRRKRGSILSALFLALALALCPARRLLVATAARGRRLAGGGGCATSVRNSPRGPIGLEPMN